MKLGCQEINSLDESGEGIKMAVTKQSSAEARQNSRSIGLRLLKERTH